MLNNLCDVVHDVINMFSSDGFGRFFITSMDLVDRTTGVGTDKH